MRCRGDSQPSEGESSQRRGLLLPPSGLDGEGEVEGGTLARVRLAPDPPAMCFHKTATHYEPQPDPLDAICFGRSHSQEGLEQLGLVLRRYAVALVMDCNDQIVSILSGRHTNLATW